MIKLLIVVVAIILYLAFACLLGRLLRHNRRQMDRIIMIREAELKCD